MQEDYNKNNPIPKPKPKPKGKAYSLDFSLISAKSRTEFLSRLFDENPNLAQNLT